MQAKAKLFISDPHGYCAGVRRSVNMLEKLLTIFPNNRIYVRRELVHNARTIEYFKERDVHFVNSILEVPNKSIALFSAHGVAPNLYKLAKFKELKFYDAVCPLVMKIHNEVKIKAKNNYHIIIIGKRNHDEIEGILGVFDLNHRYTIIENENDCLSVRFIENEKLFCVTQSTLSVTEVSQYIAILKKRFAHIEFPKKSDICYATENRQKAILNLIKEKKIDGVIVVTSPNSSNGMQLYKECKKLIKNTYKTDQFNDILNPLIFKNVKRLAITSSASTPEDSVNEVTNLLKEKLNLEIYRYIYTEEKVAFKDNLIEK